MRPSDAIRARAFAITLLTASCVAVSPAHAEYGYTFATIGDTGNAPIPQELVAASPYNGEQAGRGSVGYTYRMATTELTSVQWAQFMSTFSGDHAQWVRDMLQPVVWGGGADPTWAGPGDHWIAAPGYERTIVGGISWRAAAMYVNWLNNDQSSSFNALMSGAYDVSTFHTNPDGSFTDQPTHAPDARYWIPTLDEWLKATHYDPDRFGTGQGGWWLYPYSSDTAPVSGWPDEPGAQTSSGTPVRPPLGFPEYEIQVGDYPDARTPWGLLDASGGASEWVEEIVPNRYSEWARDAMGSDVLSDPVFDRLGAYGFGGTPGAIAPSFAGLRVASVAIPTPPSALLAATPLAFPLRRSRRSNRRDL